MVNTPIERYGALLPTYRLIQHQTVNNLSLGRNVDEMLRMVDALRFVEQYGEVCPAGWTKGKSGMAASADGVASYLADHSDDL